MTDSWHGKGKLMAYENASNQRKEMIASKFKEMLRTKSLSKISVSELIRQCGINRKTFYYHFEDIFALLKWTMEQETIKTIRQYDLFRDYETVIEIIGDYIEKNHSMLYNIYNSVGRNQLHRFFFESFRELIESVVGEAAKITDCRVSEEYTAFLIDFYTEGIAGSMVREISKPSHYRKEVLSEYIFATFRGMLQSLKDAEENRL